MDTNIRNAALRIIIIEDEVHNSRMLKGLVNEIRPQWKVEAILESVDESVKWIQNNPQPDIILMDIQLSDGISFSIFDHVNMDPASKIIFTTAYDEYAIRAFKVNSIDYLLKPIEREELEAAFVKFEYWVSADHMVKAEGSQSSNQYVRLFESILSRQKQYRTRFLVPGISSWEKIETKDISYFYSSNKLSFAVDKGGREYTLDYTLEQLESELDPALFFRANRKVIVQVDAVIRVHNDEGGKLRLSLDPSPDFEVMISRLKAGDFKFWMGK